MKDIVIISLWEHEEIAEICPDADGPASERVKFVWGG